MLFSHGYVFELSHLFILTQEYMYLYLYFKIEVAVNNCTAL